MPDSMKNYIKRPRNFVRKVTFNCRICFHFSANSQNAIMSDLPLSWFGQDRSFVHTRVELAGPYSLKDDHPRNSSSIKGYFAIFQCLSTRVLHLQALTSLSTECFLASLDRFIVRQGLPTNLFTDQGANFKPGARVIEDSYTFIKQN